LAGSRKGKPRRREEALPKIKCDAQGGRSTTWKGKRKALNRGGENPAASVFDPTMQGGSWIASSAGDYSGFSGEETELIVISMGGEDPGSFLNRKKRQSSLHRSGKGRWDWLTLPLGRKERRGKGE